MKTSAEENMEDALAYFDLWKAAEAREKALQERAEQAEEQVQRLSKYLQWIQDYPVDEQGHKQFSWTINREIMDLLKGVPSGDIAWAREVAQERVRTKLALERAEQAERALAERDALIAAMRSLLRPLCLNVHHSVHIAAVDLEPDCTCWGCSAWRRVEALTPTAASELAAAEREVVEAAQLLVEMRKRRGDDVRQGCTPADTFLDMIQAETRLAERVDALAALKDIGAKKC